MSKRILVAGAAVAALLAVGGTAAGASPSGAHGRVLTLAVYGDAPYGTTPTDTAEFEATPAFIDSVNADPDVSSAVHVGDIHSGKQYCTEAYDRSIKALWDGFADPLVYTPGDNEWTDCHKAGEGGGLVDPTTGQSVDYASGNPVANLALIRSIFFQRPGETLGSGDLRVLSQAQIADPEHPADRQYVENVVWSKKDTVFVTINVPGGSNNDADPWFGAPLTDAQTQERVERTAADLRWLDFAFGLAQASAAKGVVIITQADMWDLDGKTPAHLTNYESLVSSIASHTTSFGGPVLLLNGDSHVYRSDNPLVQGAPCAGDAGVCSYDAWNSHPNYDVPNFHRIVVHGSTIPLEWLKLTIDPRANAANGPTAFGPFSWTRITE